MKVKWKKKSFKKNQYLALMNILLMIPKICMKILILWLKELICLIILSNFRKIAEQSGTPIPNDGVHSLQTGDLFLRYHQTLVIGHTVHMISNSELTGFNINAKLNITGNIDFPNMTYTLTKTADDTTFIRTVHEAHILP